MDTLPTSFAGRQTRYKSKPHKPTQQWHHTNDVYTNTVATAAADNSKVSDTVSDAVSNSEQPSTITAADYGLTPAVSTAAVTNKRFKFTDDADTPVAVTEPVPDDIKLNAQTVDNEFYADNSDTDNHYTDTADAADLDDTGDADDSAVVAEFVVAADSDSDSKPDELSSIQWPTALTSCTLSSPLRSLDTTVAVDVSPFRNDTPRIPFSNTNATTQQTTTTTLPVTATVNAITVSNSDEQGDTTAFQQFLHSFQTAKQKKQHNKKQNKPNKQNQNNNNNGNNNNNHNSNNSSDYVTDNSNHSGIHIKYWYQRYRYFSKYDSGIKIDTVGWYSVTPEQIARHQALQCKPADTVIDAFAGVGGNVIQFALHCKHVIAVEIDPVRLTCCKHNAKVYGVADKITFILGDFMQLASTLHADVVFMSPPWGGPSYTDSDVFDIETGIPMNGIKLYQLCKSITDRIQYCLPRNCSVEQIQSLATLPASNSTDVVVPAVPCVVEQNRINNKVKMLTAYFGQFDGVSTVAEVDMQTDAD